MRFPILAIALIAASPVLADDDGDDDAKFGMAGILSASNSETLPPILLSAGQPLADAPLHLKSGTYYEIEIEADGSQELGLEGAGFFRAIWIDEIVIEGLEIRPLGIDSVEFDEAGVMEIGFVAIKPGTYDLHVPKAKGDLQRLEIIIE
ncbi:hypothetical protein SAMN04488117_101643 [Celeribacter baekdonensis]|jgi:hypothetical protein|uniref:MSP domain-containing protein n=1 Tax=Celeribacter baekdonensis TaxID=875171 RepID=A0A1G7GND7_9RHOB|nr:hypothetical protein [Celeribacter baekdonensis]SDE89616.1 hypothetical protein SAMN04488117_101643 [Celeribacter baekdonensis]